MSFCSHFPQLDVQKSKIQNPWGIVMERSGLRKEKKNINEGCKIAAEKKSVFVGEFWPNKSFIMRSIKSRFLWYLFFFPHWSRDALSPVYRLFSHKIA